MFEAISYATGVRASNERFDMHPRSIIFLRDARRYFHPRGGYSRWVVLTSGKPTGYLTARYLGKADIKYVHSRGV